MGTLSGKVALVTGGSRGIGAGIAKRLARDGADVAITFASNQAKADELLRSLSGVRTLGLRADSADAKAVQAAVDQVVRQLGRLDILVNNAGISGGPRRETADGFEAHFGVNYLGHFALTGLLLPALLARPGARVVTMSSGLAAQARINFDDLGSQRAYRMTSAYGQSKLAGLVFAIELGRRARAAGSGLASLAAHPGAARTSLVSGKEAEWGRRRDATETVVRLVQLLLAQSAAKAALPALYQATDPAADSTRYVGTRWHLRGYPAACAFPPAALSQETATRLWRASQELTGITYKSLPPSPLTSSSPQA